ncbi:MAG: alpha/beta hydrolase [Chthonomonadales bacterium]
MKFRKSLSLTICQTIAILMGMLLYSLAAGASRHQGEGQFVHEGCTLHYRTIGKGAPILMLSGGPGIDVSYLEPVAKELSRTHECILLEQRGTGRSKLPAITSANMSLNIVVGDVEALRVHLKLNKLTIFGHSWGGMLAMSYAVSYPDKVEELILCSSGGANRDFMKTFSDNIDCRLTPEELKLSNKFDNPTYRRVDPQKASIEHLKSIAPAYFFDRANVRLLTDQLNKNTFAPGVNSTLMRDLMQRNYDLRVELRRVECPVLILQGHQDPIGEGTAYETKACLQNSTITFIDKCGHFPWLERPKTFYPILFKFLEKGRN